LKQLNTPSGSGLRKGTTLPCRFVSVSTAANQKHQPRTENLAGLVERVTFHNPDNGFCVLRLKARGQRDLITVIGHAALISAAGIRPGCRNMGERSRARAAVPRLVPEGEPA
jgi:hypothetical protein